MAEVASPPWHVRDQKLLRRMSVQLVARYPSLRVDVDAGSVRVVGMFPVRHEAHVLDEFHVIVDLPDDFPRSMPAVREVGGRIPLDGDHHANADGTLCVILPDEYWFARTECDLLQFLDGPLRNYFLGLLAFLDTGRWPFGEHAHGGDGVREFYAQLVGAADVKTIKRYLDVLRRREMKPHWPCPCGSDKRMGRCHWLQVTRLHREVRPRVARAALARLE